MSQMNPASITPANVVPPDRLAPGAACLQHYGHITAVLLVFNTLAFAFQILYWAIAGQKC
jgi:hypothetical protein